MIILLMFFFMIFTYSLKYNINDIVFVFAVFITLFLLLLYFFFLFSQVIPENSFTNKSKNFSLDNVSLKGKKTKIKSLNIIVFEEVLGTIIFIFGFLLFF